MPLRYAKNFWSSESHRACTFGRVVTKVNVVNFQLMLIAVDFDGTIVEHEYPRIGREIPFATETLRMLINDRHQLILWSVREGDLLQEAIDWCHERGVDFYAINRDFPEEDVEKNIHFSRKLKVDLFIDDRNIGGLPDWGTIYRMISENKTWRDIIRERQPESNPEPPKKKWWQF